MTPTERKARQLQRVAERGNTLVRVEVPAHPEAQEALKAFARELCLRYGEGGGETAA